MMSFLTKTQGLSDGKHCLCAFDRWEVSDKVGDLGLKAADSNSKSALPGLLLGLSFWLGNGFCFMWRALGLGFCMLCFSTGFSWFGGKFRSTEETVFFYLKKIQIQTCFLQSINQIKMGVKIVKCERSHQKSFTWDDATCGKHCFIFFIFYICFCKMHFELRQHVHVPFIWCSFSL